MDQLTNEYFIEKTRMPVALTLLNGPSMTGDLYIQASARNFSALEDAPEFMNGAEAFFPLRREDGTTLLIAKDHVLVVEVPREHAHTADWSYGERARVEVVMQGGESYRGDLRLEHYVGHERVLDHLNRFTEPFLVLCNEDSVTLLNRRHIAYVRPVDDAAA